MIPKTLFLAFLSLQAPPEQSPSTQHHDVSTFTAKPFHHEHQMVIQNPTIFEHQEPVDAKRITKIDFDLFDEGQQLDVKAGNVELISKAGWIVPGYWFGSDWKFPSGRQKAYAINPTTNPRMTLKFLDHSRRNVNMTISFWDYDIPTAVTLKTEARRKGRVVNKRTVVLEKGWNDWHLPRLYFDEFTLEVQGKATTDKDLLIIDDLSFKG